MTYRTMHGLGAAALTPDQVASMFKAFNANGGCTPAFQQSLNALQCAPIALLQWFGSCYAGVTPPGMSDLEYYAACMGLAKCGAFDKLGCQADAESLMPKIPSCLPKEAATGFDYCRSNPKFDGPNKAYNTACWSASRYPDLYQKLLSTPVCSDTAPPPPDTTAHVTYDSGAPPDSSATTVPKDDDVVPGSSCASWGPNYTTDPATGECVEKKTGMSTATMAMFGIGGVLALGLGYMLLKKK